MVKKSYDEGVEQGPTAPAEQLNPNPTTGSEPADTETRLSELEKVVERIKPHLAKIIETAHRFS